MKKHLQLISMIMLAIIGSTIATLGQESYDQEIEEYRGNQNNRFSNAETSPLTPSQLEDFNGLDYFPIDVNYRFNAKLNKDEVEQPVSMQMSDGSSTEFVKYGNVQFMQADVVYTLDVFRKGNLAELANYPEQLFIPFKDKSNGAKTATIGRYIAIGIPEEGNTVIVDFNMAFNPYAAYNSNHTSPIAPDASVMNIKIMAGERKYEDR